MADSSKQRYGQRHDKVWEDIFFTFVRIRTICLLCNYEPSVVNKYILEKHYRVKHFGEYSKYTAQKKLKLFAGLKLVYQEGDHIDHNSLVSNVDNDDAKALAASFHFSLRKIPSRLVMVNL